MPVCCILNVRSFENIAVELLCSTFPCRSEVLGYPRVVAPTVVIYDLRKLSQDVDSKLKTEKLSSVALLGDIESSVQLQAQPSSPILAGIGTRSDLAEPPRIFRPQWLVIL